MKYLIAILVFSSLLACGPSGKPISNQSIEPVAKKHEIPLVTDSASAELPPCFHSEYVYPDSAGKLLTIRNSTNKGGPLYGDYGNHYEHSFLVYFMQVINERDKAVRLTIELPPDSFAIPSTEFTWMKVFLPPGTMTMDKEPVFNYGVGELDAFMDLTAPTSLERVIEPGEDCFFYTGAVFYQTRDTREYEWRGGNKIDFYLEGEELFMKMPPQFDSLRVGHVIPQH